jgi:hypothetical protein
MKNRIVSILTLGSFLVFSWSCYSLQEIKPAVLASEKAGDYKILKVKKTSGEIIEYSKESPGRVGQGNITGNVKADHGEYWSFTVLLSEVEKAWANKFDIMGTFMAI